MSKDAVDKFKSYLRPVDIDCCTTSRAHMDIGGVRHTMHQAAWRIYRSDAPPRHIRPTCGEERCCNPHHLIGSDELCAKGLHPMDEANVKRYGDGRRLCLTCHIERWSRCKRGHDLDETGRRMANGYRVCSVCVSEKSAEYWQANREQRLQRKREARREMTEEQRAMESERRRAAYARKRASMTYEERAEQARRKAEQMRRIRSSARRALAEAEGRTA